MQSLGINVDRKEIKQYAMIALAYLLLSLVMFWPIILNIASTVPGTGGDTFQSMWELWWVPYSLFTLHTTPYFTNYIFAPIGADLATQTLAPIAGLVSAVFQPLGLPFAFNMIFLIGFVLSGLFAYMLAFHVTKHKYASFIAGFIYAFSPIHTIQAFGHLQFTNTEFIPLFLLFFLKMDEGKKPIYAVGAALSFLLLTFMGDIEQGLMAMLIAFFILLYFALAKSHRHRLLDKNFLLLFGEMIAVILILGAPAYLSILSLVGPGTLNQTNLQANVLYNELYSPDLLSFFVPSQLNGILSPLSSGFSSVFAPARSERTTYMGYTVILLVLVALVYEYKEKFRSSSIYLILLVLFGLLSIGPYLQINGSLTAVPGLYQLYHQIPFFNVLREPGRFDIPLELFLAIFAAIGVVKLEGRYSGSAKKYLPVVITILLVIEYNSWPISQGMLKSMYTLNTTIPKAYSEIGQLQGNFSVLVLPALPNFTGSTPDLYPGLALYYQTAFKHPLVGGYATRTNASQYFSVVSIPLAASAYYLQTGQGLVYGSPVRENYTNETNLLLAAYNVGFVSVIRQAYNQSELQSLASYLDTQLGSRVYVGNDSIVFSTTSIVSKAGSTIVEYTPVLFNNPYSVWQPGWVVCGTSSTCNSTYLNAWFGIDPAYINIYSPSVARMNISFRALAPFGVEKNYVVFNNQPVAALNLTPAMQNFTVRVALSQGINYLVFYSTNNTGGSYSNIGIANITFKKYS
jgi:uncharacterized membrane protein YecN with MAPEG domain